MGHFHFPTICFRKVKPFPKSESEDHFAHACVLTIAHRAIPKTHFPHTSYARVRNVDK